jgi:hypothetical protein
VIVDDHRAALPRIALLRGDEDVAVGGITCLLNHLYGGRGKVGS